MNTEIDNFCSLSITINGTLVLSLQDSTVYIHFPDRMKQG